MPHDQLAKVDLALGKLGLAPGMTPRALRRQRRRPGRTLDLWAEALEASRDRAIEVQSQEVYDRYTRYLTGCADVFRVGYGDVNQFTCEK